MCEEALTADLNTPASGVTPGVVGAAPTPMFGAFGGERDRERETERDREREREESERWTQTEME